MARRRKVLSDIGYGHYITSPRSKEEVERLFFSAILNQNAFLATKLKSRVGNLPYKIFAFACETGNSECVKWMSEHLHIFLTDDAKYMCRILLSGDFELFIWGCRQFRESVETEVSMVKVQILEFCIRNKFWKRGTYFVQSTKMTYKEIDWACWAYSPEFAMNSYDDELDEKING